VAFFDLLVLTLLEKSCVFVKFSPCLRNMLHNGPHRDLSVGLLGLVSSLINLGGTVINSVRKQGVEESILVFRRR
jgi:hypothetical protein